ALLGERMCFPPNVAGWKGGTAWITSGALLLRANLAGVLVGDVELRALFERGESEPGLDPGDLGLGPLVRRGWRPRLGLADELDAAGLSSDEESARFLCEALLAVPPSAEVSARVSAFLASEREGARTDPDGLSERSLSRAAHFVLALPEAQL